MITADTRHFTASMVVFDLKAQKVLLVHHKATGKWVFPGGHVDQDETGAEAALREVREETGVSATLIDHRSVRSITRIPGATMHPSPWITAEFAAPAKPERPGKPAEPAHWHIDMLFIGQAERAGSTSLSGPADEVYDVRWVRLEDIPTLDVQDEVDGITLAALATITVVTEAAVSGGSRLGLS